MASIIIVIIIIIINADPVEKAGSLPSSAPRAGEKSPEDDSGQPGRLGVIMTQSVSAASKPYSYQITIFNLAPILVSLLIKGLNIKILN